MKFLELNHWQIPQDDKLVISASDLRWIDEILDSLELDTLLSTSDKARSIQEYVSSTIKFSPHRFRTVSGIKENGHGNCYDHALMSIIFLRRAGIAAKFARELQLYRRDETEWKHADYTKDSHWLFGAFHNDHTWVLFHDDHGQWQPLDSSMGYTGRDAFYELRTKGFPPTEGQLMSSPFAIWSAEDDEYHTMRNITQEIWHGFSFPDYWNTLISAFTDLEFDMRCKNPLSIEQRELLKRSAIQYFTNPDFT